MAVVVVTTLLGLAVYGVIFMFAFSFFGVVRRDVRVAAMKARIGPAAADLIGILVSLLSCITWLSLIYALLLRLRFGSARPVENQPVRYAAPARRRVHLDPDGNEIG